MRWNRSDLTITCGIVALIVFGHFAAIKGNTGSIIAGKLLAQEGSGTAYEQPMEQPTDQPTATDRIGQMEDQARMTLQQLGQAEDAFASNSTPQYEYAYLSQLRGKGLLLPNVNGSSMTPGYSITIYIHATKRGFSAVAEPKELDLRPLMLTENQQVVVIAPVLKDDPDKTWTAVENTMQESYSQNGHYEHPFLLDMMAHNPILQVRLNEDMNKYVLLQVKEKENGYIPDDSLIYSSYFNAYMAGDLRNFEMPQ
jgi:hypothetical protein